MPAVAPWSPEDRARLFAFIERHGAGSWSQAAIAVPGKSAKQCRDQWVNTLAPLIRKSCGLPTLKKAEK